MNILLSGASGLIGSTLTPFLTTNGHQVVKLSRRSSKGDGATATWDPATGKIDLSQAGPLDAVVHLAGETIAQRWTPAAKARISESRIHGTRLLSEALARLPQPPRVLACASATGFYGHRGDEMLNEQSARGSGFLAEVCQAWEAATQPAAQKGIRVVNLRLGIVLSPVGGALGKMLPAFRLGLGGKLGGGQHYWSWIALDDVLSAIHHVLTDKSLNGPVNVVAPRAVTNLEFTKTLGKVLGRPTVFAVPAFAIKLLFGEMGEEAMLASSRVQPSRLQQSGFAFRFPELEPALRYLLGH
jgi:uncharacterized protein